MQDSPNYVNASIWFAIASFLPKKGKSIAIHGLKCINRVFTFLVGEVGGGHTPVPSLK